MTVTLKCPKCGLTGRDNVFPEKLDDLRAFQLKYILQTKCQLIWCNPEKEIKEKLFFLTWPEKKFRPKKLVKSNKSISRKNLFDQIPFFAISKMAKNQFLNQERV